MPSCSYCLLQSAGNGWCLDGRGCWPLALSRACLLVVSGGSCWGMSAASALCSFQLLARKGRGCWPLALSPAMLLVDGVSCWDTRAKKGAAVSHSLCHLAFDARVPCHVCFTCQHVEPPVLVLAWL
jgi:hypothetical protein